MKIRKPNGLAVQSKEETNSNNEEEEILGSTQLDPHPVGAEEVKRDLLLGGMELVVDAPLIWAQHPLHRTHDGILRQALLNTEKEPGVKVDALLEGITEEESNLLTKHPKVVDPKKKRLKRRSNGMEVLGSELRVATLDTRTTPTTVKSPPIPSLDINPHPGQLTGESSEYTDHLLSQISVVLPAMSSSQVSSVLSALDSQTGVVGAEEVVGGKQRKEASPVKMETTACVRKPRVPVAKETSQQRCVAVETSVGKASWAHCSGCGRLSSTRLSLEALCLKGAMHKDRPRLKCIACPNTFLSLQSLKVHLIADHEAVATEMPDLLVACVEANRVWRSQTKNPSGDEKGGDGGEGGVAERSPSTLQLPPTPGFSLFETVEKYMCDGGGGGAGEGTAAEGAPERETSDKGEGVEEEEEKEKRAPKKQDIKMEKESRCNIDGCSARFVFSTNLEYHKQCHQGVKLRCPECEIGASSWSQLSLHLWRQHSLDLELYRCDLCPYKTNSLSKLMNLHRRTHGEERPFLCDLCGKGFKTTKQLRNHKGVHRAKERCVGGGVVCLLCGRQFSEARMLRLHTDMVHRKLRPFLCSVCGHSAASRSSLRMHARLHTGEKPYRCVECDYSTGDHNSLRRHKMRHSGAKHYTCPHCDYACIQSSTFKSHLNSKHPGLGEGVMFSCHVCSFRTVKKENLLAHASQHHSGLKATVQC